MQKLIVAIVGVAISGYVLNKIIRKRIGKTKEAKISAMQVADSRKLLIQNLKDGEVGVLRSENVLEDEVDSEGGDEDDEMC